MKKTMVFENETVYDNWFDVNEEKEGGHDFLENRVVIVKGTRTINGKKFNGFSANSTIECKNVRTVVRRFAKELNSNGFEVSIDEFEGSCNGENLHDLTGSGMVVEVEEIDDDRYYVNYMCYQDEVDEFDLTEEETEKLISNYEDFIRQMESLKEKEERVATAEPEEQTAEEPKVEETTKAEETEEEPITEENTKVTEAEEKFSETYKKNAERMYALKTLMETARDRGDRELERKYRKEYTAIKSEIDMYALQIINQ